MFVDQDTLSRALRSLRGSADHLFKVWLTLKHMGMTLENPVTVTTSNSTPSLQRLFGNVLSSGEFFVPFAGTPRFMTMKPDASRSIVQTTLGRWATSGSVVTVDPSDYLDLESIAGQIKVQPGRSYPRGLGNGKSGFAPREGVSLAIPIMAWAVWYGRATDVPESVNAHIWLRERMLQDLNIDPVEHNLIFSDPSFKISLQDKPLTLEQCNALCHGHLEQRGREDVVVNVETPDQYRKRVHRMIPNLDKPLWLRAAPEKRVAALIDSGCTAILLYGPPRTGKTHLIDNLAPRQDPARFTIQIHDGWSYEHLMEGMKPKSDGTWTWLPGPFLNAVRNGKTFVVLEEANRTVLSQALGEAFSLIEPSYRGEENAITLRSGAPFWIPRNVVIVFTMNTIDRSTEDIDDAMLGRVAAVECPPRPAELLDILTSKGIRNQMREDLSRLFADIQDVYPLGHGYFADLPSGGIDASGAIDYYVTRIRPVLHIALGEVATASLANIDNLVDDLFGS